MIKIKPQKQLVMHNPTEGRFGDCYRTAVAIVLGRDAELVPHVCKNGWNNKDDIDGVQAMREFLRGEGLAISKSVYNGALSWAAFREWMAEFNPDSAMIVTGFAQRGVNHCVVMIGGEVVCDPINGLPDNNALVEAGEADGERFWWVEVIHPMVSHEG